MSGCEAKVPALRFKGHPGSWERKRLGDAVTFDVTTNTLSRAELSQTGSVRNIHYGDVLIKYGSVLDITTEEVPFVADAQFKFDKKNRLLDGDVIMADTAEDETAGKVTEIRGIEEKSVVSGLHTIVLRPKERFANGFLGYCFNAPAYHDRLASIMQGSKVLSINKGTLPNTVFLAPPTETEQRRIGSFFRSLDALIAGREKALEKLEALKKSMLLKMFPQGDATVPEVRFRGFAGDWEKKRLGNFLEEREENNRDGIETEILSVMKDVGVIRYADKGNVGNRAKEDVTQYNIARKGDIVLNSMNVIIGSVGVAPCDGCISPAYYALRPMVNADASFWGYWFWRKESQCVISSLACGMMEIRRKISVEDLLSIVTPVPSLPEQQKIGAYFRSLDALISARRDEIAKLKDLKKALLDRMFV